MHNHSPKIYEKALINISNDIKYCGTVLAG